MPYQKAHPWLWYFNSIDELQVALEEYTALEPGRGIPEGSSALSDSDRVHRIYSQNRLIDQGMRDLLKLPKLWTLIDVYYRRGMWTEYRGWIGPARTWGLRVPRCPGPYRCRVGIDNRMDLKTCPSGEPCQSLRDIFDAQVALSIGRLFRCIQVRQESTVDSRWRTR